MSADERLTCGHCGRTFPDIYPAGRCPFEAEHVYVTRDEVVIRVRLGNALMQDGVDLADLFRRLAERLDGSTLDDGPIRLNDRNGNKVGEYRVEEVTL